MTRLLPRELLRPLLLRFGAAVVLFTLLLLPGGLARAYAGFFRAVTGPAVDLLFPVEVELAPLAPRSGGFSSQQMHDTALVVTNAPKGRLQNPVTSLWLGYVPTALFLALLLPTPIPGPRKRRALLLGLLLVQGFVVFRVALLTLDILSRPTAAALFHPGPRLLEALTFCSQMVTTEIFPSYLVPLVIWALVSFRAEDLERWRAAAAG